MTEKWIEEFEKEVEYGNFFLSDKLTLDTTNLRRFIAEVEKLAREEGRRDGIMEESIKRYEQAKEDGTLDKHFPIIKSA